LLELRRRVWSLDPRLQQGEKCTSLQRLAYKIPGKRVLLEVKVQRGAILVRVADGGCPDPNGITRDIPESHGQRQKQIVIESMDDFDAAMPFMEAATLRPRGRWLLRVHSPFKGCDPRNRPSHDRGGPFHGTWSHTWTKLLLVVAGLRAGFFLRQRIKCNI